MRGSGQQGHRLSDHEVLKRVSERLSIESGFMPCGTRLSVSTGGLSTTPTTTSKTSSSSRASLSHCSELLQPMLAKQAQSINTSSTASSSSSAEVSPPSDSLESSSPSTPAARGEAQPRTKVLHFAKGCGTYMDYCRRFAKSSAARQKGAQHAGESDASTDLGDTSKLSLASEAAAAAAVLEAEAAAAAAAAAPAAAPAQRPQGTPAPASGVCSGTSRKKKPRDARLDVIEDVLKVLQEENAKGDGSSSSCLSDNVERYGVEVFDTIQPPPLSMAKMLCRLEVYAHCSYLVFLTAGIYVDKVSKRIKLTPANIQLVYLAACVLALKWLEDAGHTNHHYASIAGISVADFNEVEVALLFELEWELQIPRDVYRRYDTTLRQHRLWPTDVVFPEIGC